MEDETTDNTDFTEESTDNSSNLKELDIIGNIFGDQMRHLLPSMEILANK